MRSFLGLASYYQRFVKGFSVIRGRVKKFPFPKSKEVLFPFSKPKRLFWKVKVISFYEAKKMILDCLEKKLDDYSMGVQYLLVEEERRLGF